MSDTNVNNAGIYRDMNKDKYQVWVQKAYKTMVSYHLKFFIYSCALNLDMVFFFLCSKTFDCLLFCQFTVVFRVQKMW